MKPTPASTPARTDGASLIRRTSLIHDHTNGGTRAADVETFARALYARQVHALQSSPFTNYHRFAHIWLNNRYGHLRQSHRLLTSACDFLQIKACPSRFWKIAFQYLVACFAASDPTQHNPPPYNT